MNQERQSRQEIYMIPGESMTLNQNFLEKQNIDHETALLLVETHKIRIWINEKMRGLLESETPNTSEIKRLVKMYDHLEFVQQGLWDFEMDQSRHRWYNIYGCTCRSRGSGEECPVHGLNQNPLKD